MPKLILTPGTLTLETLRLIARERTAIELASSARTALERGAAAVAEIVARGEPAYGINTGFGRLAQKHIENDQLELLQKNLVLSHAVGIGSPLGPEIMRLVLTLKIASLSHGYSGIRPEVVDALIALLEHDLLPIVPEKGSVGASGDLAPLAHLSAVLLGVGHVMHGEERLTAVEALARIGRTPMTLAAKEGLALLNGTQVSTAIALHHLFAVQDLYETALVSGALTVDAAEGSSTPFDERIHALRGQLGQIEAARAYRALLQGSDINLSHKHCTKVQDPYSLRCQPQVMGACLDQIEHGARLLTIEANGVTDNPLVFPDAHEVLSGGNFHAEPVAFAADVLALALAEIGALAERRIALLIDHSLSGLPAFLVKEGGVNSGFMIAHVTAAALASENKTLAHPAVVDSLPTSANQEDHVSMATFAARKLAPMIENVAGILAIELLAAAQGIDFRQPHRTSPALQDVHAFVRAQVPHYDVDRYFAPDIECITKAVREGHVAAFSPRRAAH